MRPMSSFATLRLNNGNLEYTATGSAMRLWPGFGRLGVMLDDRLSGVSGHCKIRQGVVFY